MRVLISGILLAGQFVLVGVALAKLLSVYWQNWIAALKETYSIEYEGHVFWAVEQLARGMNIYDPGSLTSEPWAVMIYNPLFVLVGAAATNACGSEFWVLRLITMASAGICLAGMHMLMRRSGAGILAALTGDAFFLGFLAVAYWSCLARVDFMGLALAVWASERFLAAWQRTERGSPKVSDFSAAILLFLLAYFTKQQYFVFPIGWVVFLLWSKQTGLALKLFGVCFGLVAAATVLLQVTTGGYLQHLVFAGKLPWEWKTLHYHLNIMATDPKTAVGLIVVLAGMFYARRLPEPERLPVAILAVSFPLVLYTMGLLGAYHNHLLSTICGFTWWVSVAIQRLPRLAGIAVAVAVLASVGQPERVGFKIARSAQAHAGTQFWMARLSRDRVVARPVLMEDPSFALLNGAQPVFVDVTTFMNVWKSDPDKLEPLIKDIERRKYPAIVINLADSRTTGGLIWPPSVVQAIELHYRRAGRFQGNGNWQVIYLPSGDARESRSGEHRSPGPGPS